ncbi:hypothetical protein [Deinococcus radiotolerans]|uniref:Uncharacterized protein n=1 Tax=Deinococcus radiotolerans TaxID=1309407 RepID=A0ABQ2FNC8_9DEIO|nr:hypothetical protein [Deinococcus radiotolerans]GGL11054.1 hypothetical protein GCM10010844_32180 [Deinococcus radiotolerans]
MTSRRGTVRLGTCILALALPGELKGAAPAAIAQSTPTTLILSPGGQVTSRAGVRVSAPRHWRPATVSHVTVTVRTVSPASLTAPPSPDVRRASTVIGVRASATVQTGDADRFTIYIPVDGRSPEPLMPLRLDTPILDAAPGAAAAHAVWVQDTGARRSARFIEFDTTTLPAGTELLFAVGRGD